MCIRDSFYWIRVAGGVMFLAGLLTYLTSFFIGPAADEVETGRARLQAA